MFEGTDAQYAQKYSAIAHATAIALVLLGVVVLGGWIFDIEVLKVILPGYISMKANTAVAFACAGISVLLILHPPRSRSLRYVAAFFALIVFGIGCFTLGEYLLHIDLKIDELLFRDYVQNPYPGRLAPITAVNFCSAGLALLLSSVSKKSAKWAQLLALVTGLSALLAIIGYAYGVPLLYGSFQYTSMALHTGVGFLILSFSVLHCQPTAGLMSVFSSRHTGGWLSRKLIPVAIATPPILGGLALAMSGFLGNIRLTIASIVVSQVILFVALIWFLSFLINRSEAFLRVSETERAETRQALSKSEELLRQSQKMEAVGQLAAGIAHDFNNLLAVIVGYSELLLAGPLLSEPQRAKLGKIKQAGASAASLTRQLLAFSRQQLVQPTTLDLNQVVTHMDGIFRRLIREDVELVISLDPDIGSVRADQGQVEQVLINLVVNGSDAMPDGGRLQIRTLSALFDDSAARRFGVAPGEFVKLSVADTGTGMSPEVKARIFEPFYTTKPIGKGTGLGLSTAYGIVRQSSGFVDVESTLGAGSAFHIYLPVESVEEPAVFSEPMPACLGGNETVLVVEDAPHLRDLVSESLQLHGYKVLLAESGAEALEMCDRHDGPIDLVITDVIMPEMNGRALVEHLKRVRTEARVIFMSGYTNDVIVRHGVFNADVTFLPKPFTPAELAQKVADVLGHKHSSLGS